PGPGSPEPRPQDPHRPRHPARTDPTRPGRAPRARAHGSAASRAVPPACRPGAAHGPPAVTAPK
ncbi:hypothetical protein AB0A86_34590, partial [Streptomyces chrestomyceticus]